MIAIWISDELGLISIIRNVISAIGIVVLWIRITYMDWSSQIDVSINDMFYRILYCDCWLESIANCKNKVWEEVSTSAITMTTIMKIGDSKVVYTVRFPYVYIA